MDEDGDGPPNRELYALLHVSPEASEDEIRKAYRQWAQVYHPDKYQDIHMKEVATQNFQRVCQAYEILTDENKRQIYDIYGMEGLTNGLELGPRLSKIDEIKEELERLRRMKEQEKASAHFRPSGTILTNLSLPHLLAGDSFVRGMAMTSDFQSQISKRNTLALGGNLAVTENSGGRAATAVLRHEISSASSAEFMVTLGLQAVVGVQTTRQLSQHSSATAGLAMSLQDGSINLSNTWTRQLSETANGNIQLVLGTESSVGVSWQKKEEKMSAAGELKLARGPKLYRKLNSIGITAANGLVFQFGTTSFGASAHYTRRFSKKSHGRIAGRIGSAALEVEVGGGRKISNFSTVRVLYKIGIQGIFWKFELHRSGQKLVIPILLTRHLDPLFAAGAFILPTSAYFILKKFVLKPYYLRREKQKSLEKTGKTRAQVEEAKEAAERAQKLLQTVANRKRNKQLEANGLVITEAKYGNLRRNVESGEIDSNSSQVIDVTIPMNFLVSDAGQVKLHEGVKKAGIMGFCDPCPGEPKQLSVKYTYHGGSYEVIVDDYEELVIPRDLHRI